MAPDWGTTSNPAPGGWKARMAGAMSRCAVDDTGRNSVKPSMRPRITALRWEVMRGDFRKGTRPSVGGDFELAGLAETPQIRRYDRLDRGRRDAEARERA